MKTAILILGLLASGAASAADLTTPQQTRDLCRSVADRFASGDIDGAFGGLLPYWPLQKEEIDALAYQSKTQMGMAATRFGAPLGAEFVRTDTVGESLVRHTFLIKYKNHALRLACYFYKPKDAWLVKSVTWDDKPQDLFD